MKNKKMPLRLRAVLATGLLITSGNTILAQFYPSWPDFLRGTLSGLGLGLMIAALVIYKRGKSICAVQEDGTE
jgi:hypothetical protein